MQYEEIKLLKQSEKSTVLLMRETGGERLFVQKVLKGQLPVYSKLVHCHHPYLPVLYGVSVSDSATTVIEEYIDGRLLERTELSEKQICGVVKELCSVLEYLHGKGIIHRDIKPSNIILAKDGHIRLIDFDAARMPKENVEQDTRLLGTRGYAPPEQYGFSQTDARADIYSLGVTLEQLLGDPAHQPHYRRIIQKCTNLNPDKRYQSARQVKRALSFQGRDVLYGCIALLVIACLWGAITYRPIQREGQSASMSLSALPAPETPHWNAETGIASWNNVPHSGSGREVTYHWRLYYREDTESPPDINESVWCRDGFMRYAWDHKENLSLIQENLGFYLWENGYYYFAVSAVGDGVHYADSPYALSDAFHYTGKDAPPLPMPTGLAWKVIDGERPQHYATWDNLDDYVNSDSFNVCVYNQDGVQVRNNMWTKEDILIIGQGGIWFDPDTFTEEGGAYRFTVQAQSSRANEYKSSLMPDPVPEEYFSPWYYPSDLKN